MEQILQRLKEQGFKLTPQRIAIVDYLMKKVNHPTAEQIYEIIKKKYPTMSIATVYNTLDMLKEIGLLVEMNIKRGKACYDFVTGPHHHFFCHECENVYNIMDVNCPIFKAGECDGHQVEEMHGYFYGICKNCRAKK